MNPLNATTAILATVLLCFAAILSSGPDEVDAAQAVEDDKASAIQFARDSAQCRKLKGADAEVFILDGQHLVCRAKKTVEAKL